MKGPSVYIVGEGTPNWVCKIGYSIDWERRFADLNRNYPVGSLSVLGVWHFGTREAALKWEEWLHCRLKSDKEFSLGGEWYQYYVAESLARYGDLSELLDMIRGFAKGWYGKKPCDFPNRIAPLPCAGGFGMGEGAAMLGEGGYGRAWVYSMVRSVLLDVFGDTLAYKHWVEYQENEMAVFRRGE